MRKMFLIILLVLAIAGAGGLGIKKLITQEQETVKITLAQPGKSPVMVHHYLALKEGFFQEYLAEVTIENYTGDEAPQETLARGQADIIVMELADFLYSKYLNSDLVAFAAVTTGEPSYIMAREKMPDFEWVDMKEKSVIGAPPESTAGILLEAVLRNNEMAPYRDVTIFYNIPPDLKVGAFEAESSTFIQATEPMVSQLESEGVARVVASLATTKIPALVYVTNSQNINKHPEKLQRFTNGIYKASLWMKYNHGQIAKNLKPEFKNIDGTLLASAFKRYLSEKIWPASPLIDEGLVEIFSNMMLDAGELPQPINCSSAIENQFVNQALQTVEYIPPEKQKKGLKKYWPF